MGSDILFVSPCCKTEEYVSYSKDDKCPHCKGTGQVWFMNRPDDPDHDPCDMCEGTGKVKEDYCVCLVCGKTFSKPIKEEVDYGDEG